MSYKLTNETLREATTDYFNPKTHDQTCKKYGYISFWDTSLVTDMSYLFLNNIYFNEILHWNTRNVTNMQGMFSGCQTFNRDVTFVTTKVTDMSYMFEDCFMFNKDIDINTTCVTNMQGMFHGCKSFNKPLLLNMNNVTNVKGMFFNCKNFLMKENFENQNILECMFINSRFEEKISNLLTPKQLQQSDFESIDDSKISLMLEKLNAFYNQKTILGHDEKFSVLRRSQFKTFINELNKDSDNNVTEVFNTNKCKTWIEAFL